MRAEKMAFSPERNASPHFPERNGRVHGHSSLSYFLFPSPTPSSFRFFLAPLTGCNLSILIKINYRNCNKEQYIILHITLYLESDSESNIFVFLYFKLLSLNISRSGINFPCFSSLQSCIAYDDLGRQANSRIGSSICRKLTRRGSCY